METEERRNTVRKEGTARASATKARRNHKAPKAADPSSAAAAAAVLRSESLRLR